MFALMGVGYFCYKTGRLDAEANRRLSTFVVDFANPCLIFTGCLVENKVQGQELITVAIVILAIYAALILLAPLVTRLLHLEGGKAGVYKIMTIFSNIGFMGIPLASSLYGGTSVLYVALFLLPYNTLIYTYGVQVLRKAAGNTSEEEKLDLSKVINVGVIACLSTLLFYLCDIPVPKPIAQTIVMISQTSAPLSMMVIGASLAMLNLRDLFLDRTLLLFSLIKLIAIPLCFMPVIKHFVADHLIQGVCMVVLATPVGSFCALLAQQYDGDIVTTSRGVALSTVLSVATIPLVAWLVM